MNTKASKRLASQTWQNLNRLLMQHFERYFVGNDLCAKDKLEILNTKARLIVDGDDLASEEVANALYSLAVLNYAHHSYAIAAEFAERTIDVRQRVLGEAHADVLHDFHVLVNSYCSDGEYELAEDAALRWLRLAEDVHGERDIYVSQILMALARILRVQFRNLETEELYLRAIALHTNLECPDCEEMVTIKRTYADFLRQVNRLAEATVWDA